MAFPPSNEAEELFDISERLFEHAKKLKAVIDGLSGPDQEALAQSTYEVLDQAERVSSIAQRLARARART